MTNLKIVNILASSFLHGFRRPARLQSRSYVISSNFRSATIVRGPIQPLDPPTDESHLNYQSESSKLSKSNSNNNNRNSTANYHHHIHNTIITDHPNERCLSIDSVELQISDLRLPYLWLRDACQSPHSVHRLTRQKLFKTTDIPLDIRPVKTKVYRNIGSSELELAVDWSHSLSHETDLEPIASVFKLSFLKDAASSACWNNSRNKSLELSQTLWPVMKSSQENPPNLIRSLVAEGDLFIDYSRLGVETEESSKALKRLNGLGIVFFENVGKEEFELGRLIKSLGTDIRRTFYGDLWDVQSKGTEAKNVANTTLSLDLHMDLVHFQNPPRFQFLHFLKNQVSGGDSSFVDSYSVISDILKNSPEHFKTLAEEEVQFEYINNNHHTFYSHRTIELKPRVTAESIIEKPESLLENLIAVNYSPPFQAPLDPKNFIDQSGCLNVSRLERFLESLKVFEKICTKDEMGFHIRLEEGQCVGFDNRRVLHARKSFKEDVKEGTGNHENSGIVTGSEDSKIKRWLKGAYVEGDSVWDRLRVLSSHN